MSKTLSDYRTETRRLLNDNAQYVQTHHSDAEVNRFINYSRYLINQELRVNEKRQYIQPEYYVDEYTLNSDLITVTRILDMVNGREVSPERRKYVDNVPTQYYTWDNLYHIDERRRVLTLLEPPEETPVTYEIKTFSRTGKKIVIDGTIGSGTVTSSGTTVTITDGDTSRLSAGMLVTANSEQETIASITDEDTFELETAPAVAWSGDTWSFLSSSSTLPHVGDWTDLKPTVKVWADDVTLDGTTDSTTTVLMADTTGVRVGQTVTGDGIPSGTTVESYVTDTSVTLSQAATASASVSLTFSSSAEYMRASLVKTDTSGTEYKLFLSSLDIESNGESITFEDGDNLQFVHYVVYYLGDPDDLSDDTDTCELPIEVQRIVPIRAAYEGFMADGGDLSAYANDMLVKYQSEIKGVLRSLNDQEALNANQRAKFSNQASERSFGALHRRNR